MSVERRAVTGLLIAHCMWPLSGCDGEILLGPSRPAETSPHADARVDGDAGPLPGPEACEGLCVGRSDIGRITATEYANSVLDVFGVAIDASRLPADGSFAEFETNQFVPLASNAPDMYSLVASSIANALIDARIESGPDAGARRLDVWLRPVPDCRMRNEGCAQAIVRRVGRSLFRRAPSEPEVAAYMNLYRWATRPGTAPDYEDGLGGDFEDGARLLIETMLQSPAFLYRIELGTPTAESRVVRLASHEVAARLASFFWRSVPDETLLGRAERGELVRREAVAEEARRMLEDPRGDRFWRQFTSEWLSIRRLDSVAVAEVPEGQVWDQAVIEALRADLMHLVQSTVRDGDGRLETLMTSGEGRVTDASAAWVLGASPGVLGAMPHRHGLLTVPAVLIANGSPTFARAHWRGMFVRQRLLCQGFPQPSADLAAAIQELRRREEEAPSAPTDRQRLEAITERAEPCTSCHALSNRIGWGLDGFDAFGRFRTEQLDAEGRAYPVDTHGEVARREIAGSPPLATDADGPSPAAPSCSTDLRAASPCKRASSSRSRASPWAARRAAGTTHRRSPPHTRRCARAEAICARPPWPSPPRTRSYTGAWHRAEDRGWRARRALDRTTRHAYDGRVYRARWMLCAIAAALVSTGCALVPIDLDGRGCPCGPGWRCDIASGACQRCLAVEECGDGGVDVLASVCDRPTPSRLFCAGFERSLESEFAGIQHSEGGRAEIVSAPVHRGAGAGLTSSDGADAPSYDSFTQWGVPLPEVIHATFWVRREALPETPASGGTAISFFSVATEHHERFFNVAMFQSGELIVIMQPVTTTGYTSRQIPIGEWNCLRFELHGENPGSARAWFVDATHEAEQELAIGWTGPRPDMRFETPYQQISVGPSYNVLPIGLVFDDIAVGSEPQPCR